MADESSQYLSSINLLSESPQMVVKIRQIFKPVDFQGLDWYLLPKRIFAA